jgi:transcriptional regulator GlxA family with amidase domain
MTLSKVEHALGMMRIYLVECATQNDWGDHRADELARTIAACLRQTTEEPNQKAAERDPRLSRDVLRRAIRFVNDNLDSKLKWDEIASDVGLDPFTFGRGFKLSTGMTPHQYIIRCRLRRAMRLLAREELSLADIALEVGCSCQSHLTTLFRKRLGTTPGAFRLSARAGQRRPAQISSVSSRNTPNQGAMRGQRSGFAAAQIQAQ